MARIRFRSTDTLMDVCVEPEGTPLTLLALARASGVPILFNCEKGSCGACLVHVTPRNEPSRRRLQTRSEREELVLRAMGRLGDRGTVDARKTANGGGAQPRLACQYRLDDGEDDIEVAFDSDLGCV
jgi:ferredoxin